MAIPLPTSAFRPKIQKPQEKPHIWRDAGQWYCSNRMHGAYGNGPISAYYKWAKKQIDKNGPFYVLTKSGWKPVR